jgi:hypothetical protein
MALVMQIEGGFQAELKDESFGLVRMRMRIRTIDIGRDLSRS